MYENKNAREHVSKIFTYKVNPFVFLTFNQKQTIKQYFCNCEQSAEPNHRSVCGLEPHFCFKEEGKQDKVNFSWVLIMTWNLINWMIETQQSFFLLSMLCMHLYCITSYILAYHK